MDIFRNKKRTVFSVADENSQSPKSHKKKKDVTHIKKDLGYVYSDEEFVCSSSSDKHLSSDEASGSSSCDEINQASHAQRTLARRITQRDRQKEQDLRKKKEQNKISMDDFLNKQIEFHTWLEEEKCKNYKQMSSPKKKVYFRTFMKLWNKRKLPQKYYRGSEEIQSPNLAQTTISFNLFDQPDEFSHLTAIKRPKSKRLSVENGGFLDSPFSTFGKTPPKVNKEEKENSTPKRPVGTSAVIGKGNNHVSPILELSEYQLPLHSVRVPSLSSNEDISSSGKRFIPPYFVTPLPWVVTDSDTSSMKSDITDDEDPTKMATPTVSAVYAVPRKTGNNKAPPQEMKKKKSSCPPPVPPKPRSGFYQKKSSIDSNCGYRVIDTWSAPDTLSLKSVQSVESDPGYTFPSDCLENSSFRSVMSDPGLRSVYHTPAPDTISLNSTESDLGCKIISHSATENLNFQPTADFNSVLDNDDDIPLPPPPEIPQDPSYLEEDDMDQKIDFPSPPPEIKCPTNLTQLKDRDFMSNVTQEENIIYPETYPAKELKSSPSGKNRGNIIMYTSQEQNSTTTSTFSPQKGRFGWCRAVTAKPYTAPPRSISKVSMTQPLEGEIPSESDAVKAAAKDMYVDMTLQCQKLPGDRESEYEKSKVNDLRDVRSNNARDNSSNIINKELIAPGGYADLDSVRMTAFPVGAGVKNCQSAMAEDMETTMSHKKDNKGFHSVGLWDVQNTANSIKTSALAPETNLAQNHPAVKGDAADSRVQHKVTTLTDKDQIAITSGYMRMDCGKPPEIEVPGVDVFTNSPNITVRRGRKTPNKESDTIKSEGNDITKKESYSIDWQEPVKPDISKMQTETEISCKSPVLKSPGFKLPQASNMMQILDNSHYPNIHSPGDKKNEYTQYEQTSRQAPGRHSDKPDYKIDTGVTKNMNKTRTISNDKEPQDTCHRMDADKYQTVNSQDKVEDNYCTFYKKDATFPSVIPKSLILSSEHRPIIPDKTKPSDTKEMLPSVTFQQQRNISDLAIPPKFETSSVGTTQTQTLTSSDTGFVPTSLASSTQSWRPVVDIATVPSSVAKSSSSQEQLQMVISSDTATIPNTTVKSSCSNQPQMTISSDRRLDDKTLDLSRHQLANQMKKSYGNSKTVQRTQGSPDDKKISIVSSSTNVKKTNIDENARLNLTPCAVTVMKQSPRKIQNFRDHKSLRKRQPSQENKIDVLETDIDAHVPLSITESKERQCQTSNKSDLKEEKPKPTETVIW